MRRVVVLAVAVSALGALPTPAPAASPFVYRGVIEGFYGPPWSHEARLAQLAWMAERGLNVYVRAPKNDAHQRMSWREPYPPQELEAFREEIAVAAGLGVAWVPNLSPGLPLIPTPPDPGTQPSRDICFSCPQDLAAVLAKLDPFVEAGARVVMLSFDDVQKASTHPEDLAAYGAGDEAYGRMNRDLLNAVLRHYRARYPGFTVFTVLADYAGTADTPYLRGVRSGGGLDPGIEVLWTGNAVVSRTIEAEGAAAYARWVGRERVVVWDNYPVNDYTGGAFGAPTRLFLGPYEGRAPDLGRSVAGVLANPMNEPLASRVALATMAEYLADPAGYDPEAAWRRALAAWGEAGDAVAALAENSRSSTLNRAESVVFEPLREAFLRALDETPFWTGPRDRLRAELGRERGAPEELSRLEPALAAEVAPFLARLRANAEAGLAALALLVHQRPALTATAEPAGPGQVRVSGRATPPSPAAVAADLAAVGASWGATLGDVHAVHGDRLAQDFSALYAGENRMDAFVGEALGRTASWLPVAGLAASSVRVTVQGQPVPLDAEGRFAAVVERPQGPVEVVATDGAGGRTGLQL